MRFDGRYPVGGVGLLRHGVSGGRSTCRRDSTGQCSTPPTYPAGVLLPIGLNLSMCVTFVARSRVKLSLRPLDRALDIYVLKKSHAETVIRQEDTHDL